MRTAAHRIAAKGRAIVASNPTGNNNGSAL
jgi:hypothetical protein